jgi:hypothetical protein
MPAVHEAAATASSSPLLQHTQSTHTVPEAAPNLPLCPFSPRRATYRLRARHSSPTTPFPPSPLNSRLTTSAPATPPSLQRRGGRGGYVQAAAPCMLLGYQQTGSGGNSTDSAHGPDYALEARRMQPSWQLACRDTLFSSKLSLLEVKKKVRSEWLEPDVCAATSGCNGSDSGRASTDYPLRVKHTSIPHTIM